MANTCNNETFVVGSFDDVVRFSTELMNDVISYHKREKMRIFGIYNDEEQEEIYGIYNDMFDIVALDRIQGSPIWFAHFIYDTRWNPPLIILDLINKLPEISISTRHCEYLGCSIGNATFHNGEWSYKSYPPDEPYCGSGKCNYDCLQNFKRIKIDRFRSWKEKGNTLSTQDEEIEVIRKHCISFG